MCVIPRSVTRINYIERIVCNIWSVAIISIRGAEVGRGMSGSLVVVCQLSLCRWRSLGGGTAWDGDTQEQETGTHGLPVSLPNTFTWQYLPVDRFEQARQAGRDSKDDCIVEMELCQIRTSDGESWNKESQAATIRRMLELYFVFRESMK